MTRSKADFKALRERVGLSQQDVADAANVTRTSVKRWERPGFNDPPADVWAWLEGLGANQDALVDEVCARVEREGIDALQLTYWRDQAQFDALGRDRGPYTMANANARAIWLALLGMGVEVSFSYPDDGDNIYHQTGTRID